MPSHNWGPSRHDTLFCRIQFPDDGGTVQVLSCRHLDAMGLWSLRDCCDDHCHHGPGPLPQAILFHLPHMPFDYGYPVRVRACCALRDALLGNSAPPHAPGLVE